MEEHFYSRYQKPLTYIILLILIGGVFSYSYLHKSLFPEITFPKIKIIADNGEQPVNKMMVTVTKPLEEAIKQVPGTSLIRSNTSRGSCEISVFLDWNADIYRCQQLIESRINQIRTQLPPTTEFTIERMNPSVLPVMGFMLEGGNKNLIELKMLAQYTVKPYLSQLDGVAKIQIQGGKEKEFWVQLDPASMTRLGVTPSMIQDAVSKTDFIEASGYGSDYRRMYLTLVDPSVYNQSDLGDLVVVNRGNRGIRLRDVANIQIHQRIEYVKVNTNGREGVLVNVIKQPDKNLLDISKEVKTQVRNMNTLLPKGVRLTVYYDQADFVGESIRSVIDAIWIGLLFAIAITVIYLRSVRSSLTILVVIPTTLALSLTALNIFGYSLNLMTLGAIAAALGLIIDDAIVVVEQIHRIWEEFPEESAHVHIKKAIQYLWPALVGSSLSTIVIFFPFSMMSGVAGAYFKVLAYTMIITLVCSFFVVWIMLPVVYLLFAGQAASESRTTHTTEPARWCNFLIHHPSLTFIFVALLVGTAVWATPRLATGFLPEMDEGTIVLDYETPAGTSLEETDQILQRVDAIINNTPEVSDYSRRTGTELGFFITEPNMGDYLIQLTNNRSKSTEEVISDIRTAIEQQIPAIRVDFGQVIGDMLGDLMSTAQPIEIKIFGNDPVVLRRYATQVAGLVEQVKGTADVFDGIIIAGPSVSIYPRENALAAYSMTPSDLWFQLHTQIQGDEVGTILEREQLTTIRMIYPADVRTNVRQLAQTTIFLPDGERKPLSDFADIRSNPGSAEIIRENLEPMADVTARLENRDLGSTIRDIQQTVSSQIYLPKGYHITYGGAYAEQQQSFRELLLILISSSILVLTIILFLFREIRATFIVFLTSILGVSGCVLALYVTGTPLNVGSYTGVIMIVGIIAENAIFTYYQFQYARGQMGMSLNDAINYSISRRLRPNVMTASAAITALLPLAVAIGVGAQLHQPLAIAVIGGFVVALPLLLMVLPTLIRLFFREQDTESAS